MASALEKSKLLDKLILGDHIALAKLPRALRREIRLIYEPQRPPAMYTEDWPQREERND